MESREEGEKKDLGKFRYLFLKEDLVYHGDCFLFGKQRIFFI
jgi:hypothetical protein